MTKKGIQIRGNEGKYEYVRQTNKNGREKKHDFTWELFSPKNKLNISFRV